MESLIQRADISVSDARTKLSHVVERARVDHEPVYLTNRGRRVAAIIDAADLERLIELAEDAVDIQAVREARERLAAGEETIPWEQVKADLGL
ncbi:type II toxin-antitoxin system Phd/YefM family antitoxin [Acaricomes phytoseiuli]|uniref:type II toxin-antitoxin system Phd/YefM family antitoxin n=1 Tax=Acaricomes phytoseiuli TaxID=291968 RepID=UPI00037F3F70|nr:type II toxin-antitoxin system Phd/YefM family antitoxin [Acaricomes phytoseiuli]